MTQESVGAGRTLRPAMVEVWDPFVRIFHWLLVLLFASAWYSGGIWDTPHQVAGYGIMALVVARIAWGFAGTRHARFSDFLYSPRATICYLADMLHLRARRYLGHNPAGGAMVMSLLAILVVLCVSGIMMTTDAFWGVKWVDRLHATASSAALVLVGFHVAGVIYASVEHGENLVLGMISGMKRAP